MEPPSLSIIWLAPQTGIRWIKFYGVIGYPSGQDGAICPEEKFPSTPYNKSFIDQACSVTMAGYWPRSFCACLWTSTQSVYKHAKKELDQYPAILTSQLVNNPNIIITYGSLREQPRWTKMCYQSGQDCAICPLGIMRFSCSHVINPSLTKLVLSRWLACKRPCFVCVAYGTRAFSFNYV